MYSLFIFVYSLVADIPIAYDDIFAEKTREEKNENGGSK